MAAVSQKIPNLLGGVSQQPDPVKLPGQVRAADNVYLDPTFGCRKRPGTEYINTLNSDGSVPGDARWFSIFRDNNERYAVALYTDPTLALKVWDLNDGTERTVTISESAEAYFSGATQNTVEQISIADYTLITNTEAEVSMNTDTSASAEKAAIVTIDQVAYNTTYNIDLAKDGISAPSKVYTATGIEVVPGSYEREDGGICSQSGAQTFTKASGAKSALSFRLVNQCQAYLKGENDVSYKVKLVEDWKENPSWGVAAYGTTITENYDDEDGNFAFSITWTYGRGVFGSGQERWYPNEEVKGKNVDNAAYCFEKGNPTGKKREGSQGGKVKIKEVVGKQNNNARYVSRHKVDVQLINGGVGWRKGDTVTASMNGKNYTIRVTKDRFTYAYNSAGSASFTTPVDATSGVLDVGAVVSGLVSAVNGISNFTAEAVGNVIKISNTAGRDFNLSVRGGVTNKAMTVIKGLARDVAELPTQCFDGYRVKVNNTEDAEADDYYVKFEAEAPGIPGAGSWTETVAPEIKTTINSSTMPHALIRQADGSFTLDALNTDSAFGGWAQREVGDETTNPEPSFVGRGISNMFFFANRLGFLSEDAVIMSQPGDYFNFFSGSAIAVSDADPIDLTASSTIPAILKGVVGTSKGLVLFAERSQFLLAANELVFSSSTVKLTEISNYFYKSDVLPLNSGVSISFISESQTYSKVLEMAVDSVENRPDVADITRAIPEYLPPDFIWGEVLPNNNMTVYGEGTDDVYVFKFFNNGDTRELAGWTRWTYPAQIKLFAAEDDLMYLVMYDGEKFILCKSELIDDPDQAPIDVDFSSFSPRIDVTQPKSAFTEVSISNTKAILRFDPNTYIAGTVNTLVVTSGDFRATYIDLEYEEDTTGPYFTVNKSLLTDDYVIGSRYVASVQLPAIFFKSENKADRVNIPMVSFLYLDLYYSGRYEVVLNRIGYAPVTKSIEITPANVYDANEAPVAEIGEATVPIFSPGNISMVTINAPGPFPSSITGYSWEGHYSNRGVRTLR